MSELEPVTVETVYVVVSRAYDSERGEQSTVRAVCETRDRADKYVDEELMTGEDHDILPRELLRGGGDGDE